MRFARATCAVCLTAGSALASNVITVDAAGGADFTNIQFAINAAADGDTILVRTGIYFAFTIDGKGVSVVEDAGADVRVGNAVAVRNVPASSRVVLSGLRIEPPTPAPPASSPNLLLEDNAGAIRLYDCQFLGRDGIPATNCVPLSAGGGQTALVVLDSPNVAIANCALQGGNGGDMPCSVGQRPGYAGYGLRLFDSTAVAHSTQILAGDTGDGGDRAVPGSDGAVVQGASALLISACMVTGGDGSSPLEDGGLECYPTGDGGDGVGAQTPSVAQRIGGTIAGGAGGTALDFCGNDGDDGAAMFGNAFTYAVSPLALDAPNVVRAGSAITLTIYGDPGDPVYLLESDETAFQFIPSWRGFVLVERSTPSRVKKLGRVPASGVMTRTYHAGDLPNGVESKTRHLQIYRILGNGVTLGGYAPLTVVDAAF